jgi:hypothetical protein
MFDQDAFITSANRTTDLLHKLGEACSWKFGTIGCAVSIKGRGVPKGFVVEISKAFDAGNPSNHQKASFQRILHTDLPAALKELRKSYAKASGGLPLKLWGAAVITFVIANGGSVSVSWELPEMQSVVSHGINLGSGRHRVPEMARRLSKHAALDLSAEPKLFEFGMLGNQTMPFKVHASEPGLALARLCTLIKIVPERFPFIREVYVAEPVWQRAHAILEDFA